MIRPVMPPLVGAIVAVLALGVPSQILRPNDPELNIVKVKIHHSRFFVEQVRFQRGEQVRFVVTNTDPIDHELIIGDETVQHRHESGSEPFHGAVPGEVTVPAGETGVTTYTFEAADAVFYACHFPGHYAYGMKGTFFVE